MITIAADIYSSPAAFTNNARVLEWNRVYNVRQHLLADKILTYLTYDM